MLSAKNSQLNKNYKILLTMQEQVFILSECHPVTPSLWLSPEKLQAIPWGKKDTANWTMSYILLCLLWSLQQRDKWGNLVVNVT